MANNEKAYNLCDSPNLSQNKENIESCEHVTTCEKCMVLVCMQINMSC